MIPTVHPISARHLKNVICIAFAVTLLSCASTTGTKTTPTSADLSKITQAGILVESKHTLSVRVAREQMTNTGAVLFGVIGAAVEAGYKSSKDSGHEEEIGRGLGDFDPVKDTAAALRAKFLGGKVFPIVEIVQSANARELKEQGFDAVFKETIEEWGLRLCSGEENVQVGFDIHAQLVSLQTDRTIWERDELFLDGPCRPLSDFRADRALLRNSLKQATETLAGRIANEIAFP